MDLGRSLEEQAVASAVASLSGNLKRSLDDNADAAAGFVANKIARIEESTPATKQSPLKQEELQEAPFFFYKDHSREVDPDPLTPLTAPGRVPNFPAKMHAILSRSDLTDIVAWMPHGRSFRVLKPREFEVRVIPTYFEHSKFSSFIRQANGWGFRRITQGRDRNSYYHPLFLRGLPHLCKKMKRPGVAEKAAVDPDHEPDFYQISKMFPLPEKASDESIALNCTVQGGPKARMPICMGAVSSTTEAVRNRAVSSTTEAVRNLPIVPGVISKMPAFTNSLGLTPKDQAALVAFHQSIAASDNQIRLNNMQNQGTAFQTSTVFLPQASMLTAPSTAFNPAASLAVDSRVACLAEADRLAFALHPQVQNAAQAHNAAAQAAASQFAAGFAAATAAMNSDLFGKGATPDPIHAFQAK